MVMNRELRSKFQSDPVNQCHAQLRWLIGIEAAFPEKAEQGILDADLRRKNQYAGSIAASKRVDNDPGTG